MARKRHDGRGAGERQPAEGIERRGARPRAVAGRRATSTIKAGQPQSSQKRPTLNASTQVMAARQKAGSRKSDGAFNGTNRRSSSSPPTMYRAFHVATLGLQFRRQRALGQMFSIGQQHMNGLHGILNQVPGQQAAEENPGDGAAGDGQCPAELQPARKNATTGSAHKYQAPWEINAGGDQSR